MAGVQSIERAFQLLRALAAGPAGVTELAERAELPKSTVARLLGALEQEEAVQQDEAGGEYRIGRSLGDLAGATAWSHILIAAARPHLWELTDLTGETSGVARLDRDMVVYLDHYESDEEVQVRSWTGERLAPHLVPSGLVLLSGQPRSVIDNYLAQPLSATTPDSVTEPDAIRKRLDQVREEGFIWIYAEFDSSINSVAAPVVDNSDTVVAAIHVHGPAYRFPEPGSAEEIGGRVREAGRRLSSQLA